MKNNLLLTGILLLCLYLLACSKGGGTLTPITRASLTFTANDSMINFPVSMAYIQDVVNVHTTLITGQYADTSSKKGSISIRLVGDTTGRYQADSLLVTYTNPAGLLYYNTKDTSNYVRIDKFAKTPSGIVNGGFNCRVYNGSDTIRLSDGTLLAHYQD
jgi:hypothetical protein